MTAVSTPPAASPHVNPAVKLRRKAQRAPSSLTPPFEPLGRLEERVTVAREGALWRVGTWLALNRSAAGSPDALWRACQDANPDCFKTYAIVRLEQPSFFLPAGESVFEFTLNPVQIPENPPQGVMMRHWEAMEAYPFATFYCLAPVFMREPHLRLYPACELRAEARGDQHDAMAIARLYGWAFRANAWRRRRSRELAVASARAGARLADTFARRRRALLRRVGATPRMRGSLEELIVRAERRGQTQAAQRYRRSLEELRWRMAFDPILCFERAEEPGRLWFEAHWYLGQDGRTYVHY